MKRTPQAKIIRRALALTQEEFAVRYHIPLGTLRDWEQGRARPDRPTQAYLKIIACEPTRVERLLNPGILLKPMTAALIRRGRGILKRAHRGKPLTEDWAKHKRQERALEERHAR